VFLGLFKKKVTVVKVKRKKKPAKAGKIKAKSKKTKRPSLKKRTVRAKRKAPQVKTMPQAIGRVTHYFPHVKAGVILVTKGKIVLGDTLLIKGHTTELKQKIN